MARDFAQAVTLQKHHAVKNIVTQDEGTEFKPGGLISGGEHAALKSLKLGGAFIGQRHAVNTGMHGLDKQILKLVESTQYLEAKHAQLKRTLADDYQHKQI